MPADASPPIPPAFDQLREHPGAAPGEIPGMPEHPAEVPGPRDPRSVRHALAVMLALTTCAVLAGATSLLAAGELATLNGYAATAARQHLPALAAVDVAMTEPSPQAARDYLAKAGPLDYPVGVDATGQVADGYGVQDQPWLALVDRTGKITWSNPGWLPLPDLIKAAQARS